MRLPHAVPAKVARRRENVRTVFELIVFSVCITAIVLWSGVGVPQPR